MKIIQIEYWRMKVAGGGERVGRPSVFEGSVAREMKLPDKGDHVVLTGSDGNPEGWTAGAKTFDYHNRVITIPLFPSGD